MYRIKLCIILFSAVIPFALFPQANPGEQLKKCPVNTINYEQGLLNNEVVAVITDSLGFTWVSTIIGLQRYNGYTLENINPVVGNDTIKIKSPVYFFNLQNGRLWISYKKGVLEYNPQTNSFRKIISTNLPPGDFYTIMPVKETREGIWAIERGKGLTLRSLQGKLISVDSSIGPGAVSNMFGRFEWLAGSNKDFLFIRDASHTRLFEYSIGERRLVAIRDMGTTILEITCNENSAYVNTSSGITQYAIAGWKPINKCSFKNLIDGPLVFSHAVLVNNHRLLASVNGFLMEYSADLSQRKIFTRIDGSPILSTGNIGQIYYDKFERIWLVTNDDIKRIQDRDIPFAYLKYPAGTNNFVRSLYFDESKKQLLAGCLNGGILLYDSLTNPLWKSPLVTQEVKDVLGIEKLANDNYLVVTWQKGWYLLNLKSRRLSNMAMPAGVSPELLSANLFSSNLQRINDSTLLVACSSNVLKCIFRGAKLIAVSPMIPDVGHNKISSFVQAADGALWAGCINGTIFKREKDSHVLTVHLPEDVLIRSMSEDANGNVWVGSNSGLYVYSDKNKLIGSFFKSTGLLNDCIYSIMPLKSGSAVFAGNNLGLSYISLNGVIKNYTKELGLQDNEFNTDATCRTAAGKFYFGGVSGISAFYPKALTQLMNKPVLSVTRLVVNDSSYNSSAGTWKGDTIELSYNQNHLQFDFAAMGLLSADKYLYRYRIASFEKKWQSTYQPTGIKYTLSPGRYLMEVSCSNALSGQALTKTLMIIIHSPWWLTWWFLLIVAAICVAIVIWTVSFYNKRKFARELQELMIKQTIQTERERISRDLHDNLGAQANAIFYGTEQLKKINGQEQSLVDDLHDTAGDMLTVLRETLWAMRITQVDAAELWLRILNFAKKMGPYYSRLKIEIGGTPPPAASLNASMALNLVLIVQEAITNAIRHSDASVITISGYNSAHFWQIEIADNGKGFDPDQADRKRESYGIDNMKERANQSGIGFKINSLPNHGTKVCLEIGINKMESQLN